MLRYGITSIKITSAATLDKQRLTPRAVLAVTFVFALFVAIPFLFEDFFFLMYWFLL